MEAPWPGADQGTTAARQSFRLSPAPVRQGAATWAKRKVPGKTAGLTHLRLLGTPGT